MKKLSFALTLTLSTSGIAAEKTKSVALQNLKSISSKNYQLFKSNSIKNPPEIQIVNVQSSTLKNSSLSQFVVTKTKLNQNPLSKFVIQMTVKDLKIEGLTPAVFSFKTPKDQLLETEFLTDDQFKFLFAKELIKNKSDLEVALALFASLFTNKELSNSAKYHYAEAAFLLKLPNEAYNNLNDLINNVKNEEIVSNSFNFLFNNSDIIPKSEIVALYYKSLKLNKKPVLNDNFAINLVRSSLNANDLTLAFEMIESITSRSDKYSEAMILKSLLNYRMGKIQEAKGYLEEISKDDSKILNEYKDISYLTLARIYFQLSDFKKSYESYLKINKKSNFWLQASVEQAWTQIMQEDFEGAAGNMFSLHTEFYKNIYLPDSYTARSIAYLNLCQFGDSLKVINDQSRKYSSLLAKLEPTLKIDNFEYVIYDKIKELHSTKSKTKSLIPESILFELTTAPDFIRHQKGINNLIDENEQFNTIVRNLLNKEKELIAEKSKYIEQHMDVNRKKKTEDLKVDATYENQLVLFTEKMTMLKNLRVSIKNMADKYTANHAQQINQLEKLATFSLKNKLSTVVNELKQTVKNNESLEFEIQSRAGEHLRTQLATQDLQKKDSVALQPNKDKSLHWKYSGEVWEDEIGHFRSSLKNVCPSTTAQNN